jgi:hypothetical protein
MAKRRSTAHLAPYQFRRAPAAPAAIVVRTRSVPAKRKQRRRRGASSGGGGMLGGGIVGHFIGGALFGFAVKQGWVDKLPEVPVIGRTGAAAFGLNYFAKHGGGDVARKMAVAAAVLAGYQLGDTGSIHGDEAAPGGDGY